MTETQHHHPEPNRMRIRIVSTIEIDPDAWALEYGIDPKDVRQDAKAYFDTWLQDRVRHLGLAPQEATNDR